MHTSGGNAARRVLCALAPGGFEGCAKEVVFVSSDLLGELASMNMRTLTVMIGAAASFVLGACTVVSTSGGGDSTTSTTGSGGNTASGTVTATSSATAATAVSGSGTGGGTACDPEYTCAAAITPETGAPASLCDGEAKAAYDTYTACTCTGACKAACGETLCMDRDPSTACKQCVVEASAAGCGHEFDACGDL